MKKKSETDDWSHLRLMELLGWVFREGLLWAPVGATPLFAILITIGSTVIVWRLWERKVAQQSRDSHISSFLKQELFHIQNKPATFASSYPREDGN